MAYRWYYRRYRPNAFHKDQKGTCRICDKPIYFYFDPEDTLTTIRTRGAWMHEGFDPDTDRDAHDHYSQPKEFCCESVTVADYDDCGQPVKYEDVKAENYACGRHMRKFMESKAYAVRAREQERKRQEREALEAYEAAQYQKAADWIKEHFPQLIEDKWEAKPRYGRFNRTTKVDVFLLQEFLEGIVHKLADYEPRTFVTSASGETSETPS